MTLKEACNHALTILKQVMEEKLDATNVEVSDWSKSKWFEEIPGADDTYIVDNPTN